ncbi:MAG TPA: hypothetical protein VK088_07935 [Acidimicrobiia bacterium]|nr:hypothetical protein [Acidimicrobiia bacterium]
MMTHVDHRLAKALREEARVRADEVRRSHPDGEFLVGGGVKDAIGHGLIALGSRLVTDPHEHPRRRAA